MFSDQLIAIDNSGERTNHELSLPNGVADIVREYEDKIGYHRNAFPGPQYVEYFLTPLMELLEDYIHDNYPLLLKKLNKEDCHKFDPMDYDLSEFGAEDEEDDNDEYDHYESW